MQQNLEAFFSKYSYLLTDSAATAGNNRKLLSFVLDDPPVHREVEVEVVRPEDVQSPSTHCGDKALAAYPKDELVNALPRRPTGEFKADLAACNKLRYHVDGMVRFPLEPDDNVRYALVNVRSCPFLRNNLACLSTSRTRRPRNFQKTNT